MDYDYGLKLHKIEHFVLKITLLIPNLFMYQVYIINLPLLSVTEILAPYFKRIETIPGLAVKS